MDCPDLAGGRNRPHYAHASIDEFRRMVAMHVEALNYLLYQARPAGLVLEAANPRHEHEWAVFQDHPLPDDKVLVTGVLDSGTDCGFATFAARRVVEPRIAWLKFDAMAEGARIASQRLWS